MNALLSRYGTLWVILKDSIMQKLIVLFFSLLSFLLGQSQTKNFIDQPYIEVSGKADSLVTPNEIFIKIIISEKDTKNRSSVEELETKMIAALKALGIETEKDLTLSDMTSNFKFYILKGADILKTKEYVLKVHDAMTTAKVFKVLEDLDISNTSIDRVDHTDLDNIKNLVRIKAMENAKKAKAVALTKPPSANN
jgi:uncharacterized protein